MQNIDEQQHLHFPSPSVRHWSITRVPWWQNPFTKLIQSKRKVQAGAGERSKKCGKILHSNQRRKKNPIIRPLTSCQNADQAWICLSSMLARLFPKSTLPTSSASLPLMPLLWSIVNSHGPKSAISIITIGLYLTWMFPDMMRTVFLCYLNHGLK